MDPKGEVLESFPQPDIASMTSGELWAHHDALEAAAASLLGRMLFEFSRIDVNLGLCLVWVDAGVDLERLTPQVAALSFHSKLSELAKHVERKLPEHSDGRVAHELSSVNQDARSASIKVRSSAWWGACRA